MLRFLIWVSCIGAAATAAVYFATPYIVSIVLDGSGQIDAERLKAALQVVPAIVTIVGTAITAGTSVLIVKLQQHSGAALEDHKKDILAELDRKRNVLAEELEAKKNTLAKDLEQTRMQIRLKERQVDSKISKIEKAFNLANSYEFKVARLRQGAYLSNEIADLEPELASMQEAWDPQEPLYLLWAVFLQWGQFLCENASQGKSKAHWKEVWEEPVSGSDQATGVAFAIAAADVRQMLTEKLQKIMAADAAGTMQSAVDGLPPPTTARHE